MKIADNIVQQHYLLNKEWWEKNAGSILEPETGYLERQEMLTRIRYGRQSNMLSALFLHKRPLSAKENSCEVIAVYNGLCCLQGKEKTPSFVELLADFERKDTFLWGYFGTGHRALPRYFRQRGYEVTQLSFGKITKERLERIAKENEAEQEPCTYLFMTMNNRKNIFDMIHTMCVTKEAGGYRIHNDYEGNKIYDSLAKSVFEYHNGKGKPLYFWCVKNKKR